MMQRFPASVLCIAAVSLSSGCLTLIEEQAAQNRTQNVQIQSQRVEIEQLRARIEWLEKTEGELLSQISDLRSELEATRRQLRERADATERALKALDEARLADKDEITSRLATRMAELLKAQSQPAAGRTRQGYEHVVKPGETLSAIASAYKVRVSAIAEANNITNPHAIKPGQKLFIPE